MEHFFVTCAGRVLSYPCNIVPLQSQLTYDLSDETLVSEKAHSLFGRYRPQALKRIGRKRLRGENVLARQARISIQDRVHRPSLTKQAKDNFNRYARTSNDRLSHHDLRILRYSFVSHMNHSAAIAAPTRACSISRSARRYSTGITFTNFGRYSAQLSQMCRARAEPV